MARSFEGQAAVITGGGAGWSMKAEMNAQLVMDA
jgi:hypothetical protein